MATAVQMQAAADLLGLLIRIKSAKEEWIFESRKHDPNLTIVMNFKGPLNSGHFDALVPKSIFEVLMKENMKTNVDDKLSEEVFTVGSVGSDPPVDMKHPVAVRCFNPSSGSQGPQPVSLDTVLEVKKAPSPCEDLLSSTSLKKSPQPDFKKIITITNCNQSFPIKVKINGRKLVGMINEDIEYSLLAPVSWLIDETLEPVNANVCIGNVQKEVKGVFTPQIHVSKDVFANLSIIVSDLPEGIDLILGKNFVDKFHCQHVSKDDVYVFHFNGHTVTKAKPQATAFKGWSVLTVLKEPVGKLFKVNVRVDGLDLLAALDLGAVRTIINSKFCADRQSLRPAKIFLKTAGDTLLKADGIYKPSVKLGDITVTHPVVSAHLPSNIDLLIGNDFLEKYKANISWETELAHFKINGTNVCLKRVPGVHETTSNANGSVHAIQAEQPPLAISVFSTRKVIVHPGDYNMVMGRTNIEVLPAIVSPVLIENNPSVTSMECLMLENISVPVFNCTNSEICIPSGTKIGYVEPENKMIDINLITETNLAEIKYALQNNLLRLDEISSPDLSCFVVIKMDDFSIPDLDNADITVEQKVQVRNLCLDYHDVFSETMKPHATIPNVLGHLERKNESTIFRRQWPLSCKQKAIARKEIDKFIDLGIVEEGPSIVNLPFFVIEKRDSTPDNPRGPLLYDSRLLNKALVKPNYKSYTIQEILSYCSNKSLLCSMDVVNYFFTIEMSEESKLLLGFTFENRALRWARLPQGCSHSPQIAQIAMSTVLRNLPAIFYVDDVVIGGESFEDLFNLFAATLHRMRINNLCLNPKKAILFQKTIPVLGLIITAGESVRPNPDRFKPLIALKNPKNCAELKSVICFFSYHRRYIKNFGIKMQRYNDMANEKIPFTWTQEDEREIESMYQYLLSTATLSLFDETLPTKLWVDASKSALGAMLTQKRDGRYKPIGYFSAPILGNKLAWSSYHKECFGLYEGVKYFENELRLVSHFTVVSDCTSLKYLLSMQSPKAPFDRFISFLSQFSFDFEFVSSENNKVPDALSRLPPPGHNSKHVVIPIELITKIDNLAKRDEEFKVRLPADRPRVQERPEVLDDSCSPVDQVTDVMSTPVGSHFDSLPITSFTGNFRFLSNFYPCSVFYDGRSWPSVEHAFQAAKTDSLEEKDWIHGAPTPAEAKRIGKLVTIKENWDDVKVQVMLKCLTSKFAEGTKERDLLAKTKNAELVENNYYHDDFWGNCLCQLHKWRMGENVLGQTLMLVRSFINPCHTSRSTLENDSGLAMFLSRQTVRRYALRESPTAIH
ncbi:Retrovirus-related Pol polyprotein from transposon 412 [Frankliniella fusca]|uniref:RNA-directed DNA polymerase n=1 Tax=Frankliniella fusca TaxID=407009 RepID=A0AAE1LFQ6_9NEOP|nr:Retrovirus-related Pol polyprotein from transposon 412 [Frankliniella fusca]